MLPVLDYKRIILAVLLLVIGIGLIGGMFWLVFLRRPADITPVNTDTAGLGGGLPGTGAGTGAGIIGAGGTLPGGGTGATGSGAGEGAEGQDTISQIAQGSLTQVTGVLKEKLVGVNLEANGFNYLSAEDNKFYRWSLSGKNKLPLSQETFAYVDDVTWSPDGRKVILEYPDGSNIVYDFTRNKKATLPTGAEDLEFDSSSDNIAYKFVGGNEEDNWLVVSDVGNTSARAVEPVGNQGHNVQVSWSPNNQVVALYHKPIGLNREEVFFVGLKGENFKSMVVEGTNFTGKWSPDGRRILYHVIRSDNDYNPVLWIVDAQAGNIGNNNFLLGLSTWVNKCIFASADKVY